MTRNSSLKCIGRNLNEQSLQLFLKLNLKNNFYVKQCIYLLIIGYRYCIINIIQCIITKYLIIDIMIVMIGLLK